MMASFNENALIIFVKNPILGKIKTRLAATMGNEKALKIYQYLLAHTRSITKNLEAEKYVFYSNFIDKTDEWSNEIYHKKKQISEPDLGLKMAQAFREIMAKNHQKVVIIGSDCIDLSEEILQESYQQLIDNEVVIGAANDGGYYLIGFDFRKLGKASNAVLDTLFIGKKWSHAQVFEEAIAGFRQWELKYAELPKLTDIDEEKDIHFTWESLG